MVLASFLEKLLHFCHYQERSYRDVKDKLRQIGIMHPEEQSHYIAHLIETDSLNESRFAHHYACGKYRMKQWGRIKIRYHLQQHEVSSYNIQSALSQDCFDNYQDTIRELIVKKEKSIKKDLPYIREQKLKRYLYQKGYETDIVQEILNDFDNR